MPPRTSLGFQSKFLRKPNLASSDMAMASDRAEVDTARPFRSVKEAVVVFGERLLAGDGHFKPNAIAAPYATPETSNSTPPPNPTPSPMPVPVPATVPMYSAPSSPPSCTSSPSPYKKDKEQEEEQVELMIMKSIEKLEAEMAETRQEMVQLKKRESEMELAVASLNAQLHRGLSKLAEMEAEKVAAERGAIREDSDMPSSVRSERWGEKAGGFEYLPSFGHALSLGEIDEEFIGKRKRRVQKKKPIVPLIGDMLFCKKKSSSVKNDSFYTEEFYSVLC